MISTIRINGVTTTMELDGATDSLAFRAYVDRVFVPSLHAGDVVVMDNLRAHYDEESIKLIERIGAGVLFLPPYSPDFNPIEKMWSKIKSILRKLKARSQKELSEAIAKAFESVTPVDAMGWFSSCHITATQS